jgi:hypothetical protein
VPALAPPPAPLDDFWVKVCVELRTPLPTTDQDFVLTGYFQSFGIRCHPAHVRPFLTAHIDDGPIRWDLSEVDRVDVTAGFDPDIEERIVPVVGKGIWYRSGRAFFSESGESKL